jgi:hypothetical protein
VYQYSTCGLPLSGATLLWQPVLDLALWYRESVRKVEARGSLRGNTSEKKKGGEIEPGDATSGRRLFLLLRRMWPNPEDFSPPGSI